MSNEERVQAQWSKLLDIVDAELDKLYRFSRGPDAMGQGERQSLEACARTLRQLTREVKAKDNGREEGVWTPAAIEETLAGRGSSLLVVPEAEGG